MGDAVELKRLRREPDAVARHAEHRAKAKPRLDPDRAAFPVRIADGQTPTRISDPVATVDGSRGGKSLNDHNVALDPQRQEKFRLELLA